VVAQATTPNEPMMLARDDAAEQGVLKAVLCYDDCLDDISSIVKPAHFFLEDCRVIYEAMLELRSKGKRIDATLLIDKLKRSKQLASVGGINRISDLVGGQYEIAFVRHYAEIVRRNAMKRKAYCAANEIARNASDETYDSQELFEQLDGLVFSLRDEFRSSSESVTTLNDILHQAVELIDRRSKGDSTGIKTGFHDLDKIFKLRPSELTIIAGRPSMGKSALAGNIALNVAQACGGGVLFVSLEMAAVELGLRFIAAEGRMKLTHMNNGTMSNDERQELLEIAGRLSESNLITVDDTPGRSVWDIAAMARRMKRSEPLHLIVIDYLQLITPTNRKSPRQEQVAEMSRSLKLLAKELQTPIICLAQVNRQLESDKDKRPKLSHLRESGAIEQDADNVIFVHRPGYYDESLPETSAEFVVAKQRNGTTAVVEAAWFREYTRFDSVADAVAHENYNEEFSDWSGTNEV
jgi:replicative DNA helicase